MLLFQIGSANAGAEQTRQMRGRELFRLCEGCHSLKRGEHLFGPSLAGVFNRRVGSVKGYDYSAALQQARFRWDEQHLRQWLADASANMLPGTRMEFGGIQNASDMQALIAYLKTAKEK